MPVGKKVSAEDVRAQEDRYESGIYTKRPVVLTRGKGSYVWDIRNTRYIDCGASFGTCLVGHANTAVTQAIQEQAERLVHVSNIVYNDVRAALMAKLVEITPPQLTRVFLCNSGTEANEAAIKFARAATGRPGIISAKGGFHGRTMGALSATPKEAYQAPFRPLVPGFSYVPYGDAKALAEAVTKETAAVLLEPVQGEGGVRVPPPEYLAKVRKLCDEKNVLLLLDEVQTGLGRTGKLFAFEHSGAVPDMLCLAKGLGNGVPIGAVVMREEIPKKLAKAAHGTTFGGNPLAAAAALATIDQILERNLPQHAAELGAYFMDRLRAIKSPLVREVRGLGLMVGVELKAKAQRYLVELLDKGVIAIPAGNTVLRFLPPLVLTKDDADFVVEQVEAVLGAETIEAAKQRGELVEVTEEA